MALGGEWGTGGWRGVGREGEDWGKKEVKEANEVKKEKLGVKELKEVKEEKIRAKEMKEETGKVER